jgi:hypothetical protein
MAEQVLPACLGLTPWEEAQKIEPSSACLAVELGEFETFS